MDVDHALGVGSRRVDGRVQHETGDVDSEVRCSLFDQVALRTINKMLKKRKTRGTVSVRSIQQLPKKPTALPACQL